MEFLEEMGMVKFTHSKPGASGPSSSIGIVRYFDTMLGGPQLTPEFVVGIAVVFTLVMLALQAFVF